MDVQKIVVVVEDVEAARTALEWALRNLLRCGDVLTLLHVFPAPPSRSRKKMRLLRLRGFHLALSFKEICSTTSFNTNIEMIVTEGDEEGRRIVAVLREIGAHALVLGLHQHSFLYRIAAMRTGPNNNNNSGLNLNCRIVAVKQPVEEWAGAVTPKFQLHSSTNLDFSQVDLSALHQIRGDHEISPPKIPYRICPSPHAIIWRSRKSRKKKTTSSSPHLIS